MKANNPRVALSSMLRSFCHYTQVSVKSFAREASFVVPIQRGRLRTARGKWLGRYIFETIKEVSPLIQDRCIGAQLALLLENDLYYFKRETIFRALSAALITEVTSFCRARLIPRRVV